MEFVELKKTVKTQIMPCYFCYGDDDYVLSRAVAILSALATLPEFNVSDREYQKGEELIEDLMQLPVMSDRRVVIARGKVDTGVVEQYLKDPNPTSVLVLISYIPHDSWKNEPEPDIPSGAEGVRCYRLNIKYVYPFVRNIGAKYNAVFTDKAVEALYNRCSKYMSRINAEAIKLAGLCSGGEVTERDVELNVEPDAEYVVFELGDCILSGKTARALTVLEGMAKTNDLTAAFPLLYNRFKRMFAAAVDPDGLADLGIKPGMAARLKSESAKVPKARLKRMMDMLADADYSYKTGEMTVYDALSAFVVRASYGGAM